MISTHLNAAEIAHHLHGKRVGENYLCRCPAHDDKDPSLSIREGRDQEIVAHCFGGCSQEAVIAALRAMNLWPEREKSVIVAEYNYHAADGKLVYQVCRTTSASRPKGFFQRKPDGVGGWDYHQPRDEDKVLYRLREVLEAPIVFLVEGEKDVESLRDFGFTATTNAGGAEAKWLSQYKETLAGRETILIPDNDAPGFKRGQIIATELINVAAPLILLKLPPTVKDITDWFLAGHSELELIAMVEAAHAEA